MNYRALERNFLCFRSGYYHVPLEKISDDFPAERIGTFETVCRECGPAELEEDDLNRYMEGKHIMMSILEYNTDEEWTRRYRRYCYFCLKPVHKERAVRTCADCRSDLRIMCQEDIAPQPQVPKQDS